MIVLVESFGHSQRFDVDTPDGYKQYARFVVQDEQVADEQIARLRAGETLLINEDQPEFFERHSVAP